MNKLLGFPHASWFYSLTIILVVFSLLFSPLAGLGSRALAEGNESAAVQTGAGSEDLGNITNPEPATSPTLQPSESPQGNDSIVPQITPTEEPAPTPIPMPTPENPDGTSPIISSVPPVISGVQVTDIRRTWVTIVWSTDKPTDTVLNYGTSTMLGLTVSDGELTTSHSIALSGLEPGVTYYYEVQATHYSSNTVTDDNGGLYYSFTTPVSDVTGEPQAPELQPSEPQKIEPRKTTALVSPDKDVELKSPSEKIKLNIPAGAASENLRVDFTEQTPWGSTGMRIVNQFELNAYAVDRADAMVSKFDKELQITIKHSPEDLRGLDTDSLRLFYLDEKAQQWVPVESSKYDKETMVLTATVDHFTQYGEQANPAISGPGMITDAQVSLSSGTATFSYPIEVPTGPGGFQPNIELTYNSGGADEMKNKRDVGSWVGIGWTLDLGGISHDAEYDEYYLNVNGVSSKLVKDKDGVYHTVRESFYKITRAGQTWHVYGPDGTYYRFGNTTNSQRYFNGGEEYYRWDLDYVRDTHGKSYSVTYFQNMYGTTVRSAYPSSIRYNNNNFEIYFNIGLGYDPTYGNLRLDNPRSTTYYPQPPVVENCWLNYIETRIDSARIRKYVFTYNTTACVLSNEYSGGIYYSGNHTLTSITEVGADGSSTLPATTFTYTGLQTYLHVTSQPDYPGNPGNPASFYWPHLTGVTNGYGATVNFSYTQVSDNTTNNIWTREVVTTKTINPGIGLTQTYQYTYTGNPQYIYLAPYGDVWHSEYRGFYQVRETDAAGNYVQHYYYTTGTMLNEYLTGKESAMEWYNASNFLLKRVEYDWQYRYTAEAYVRTGVRPLGEKRDVAVNSSGEVYALDFWNNYIAKYGSFLYPLTQWGSQGTGDGQFNSPSGIAVDSSGNVWVADSGNNRVQEFDSNGTFIKKWSAAAERIAIDNSGYVYLLSGNSVKKYTNSGSYVATIASSGYGPGDLLNAAGVAVDNNGYVYVIDCRCDIYQNHAVKKYTDTGNYTSQHGDYGCDNGRFCCATDITVDSGGNHWVLDANYNVCIRSQKFDGNGTFLLSFPMHSYDSPSGIAVASTGEVYIAGHWDTMMYASPYFVYLSEVRERTYTYPSGSTKVSKTRYLYDSYGNVVTEYRDGDTSTTDDDATVQRVFYPNTSAWILDRPARERVYATITGDVGGANRRSETIYYYDGANSDAQWVTPPTKGDLTRLQQYKDASSWVNTYYTYDNGGNQLTVKDPNNNTTTYVYSIVYGNLPTSKTYPTVGSLTMTESYTWDYGSGKIMTETDVNNQTTTYEYDTFKRLIKVYKPGDSIYNPSSPTIQYQYNNWGTINQQHLKTLTKLAEGNYTWQSQYFDGLGRVVQTQAQGETEVSTEYTIISATTTYNNRGLVDKEYVSQKLLKSSVTNYYTPAADWKYTTYAYDALGRVTTQTNADSTTIGHDFSTPWRDQTTDQRGYKTNNYYDAFQRLVKVEELDAFNVLYSTTTYSYDVLNNLVQVKDTKNNTSTMNYDWLSRKTSMSDPDMGSWSYTYDNNGNLQTQTDAKSQTITFTYDVLNRLTGKSGTGLSASYTYDSTTGGNNGEGKRTGMTDVSGSTAWKYDNRGRLIEEKRTIDAVNYTTQYSYNPADWLVTVTYPTGEIVTQTPNGRGLPYSLSGSVAGNIVTSTLYNKLGQYTEINLNNGIKTTFGYYGVDYGVGGSYDTSGGYYDKLYEIKSAVSGNMRQDMKYNWDASGNLAQRVDSNGYTETFTYDFLDRLTSDTGAIAPGGGNDTNVWYPMGKGTSNNLTGVWGSSSSDVFAVGVNNTIVHYDGSAWTPMSGATNWLYGVWGSSSSDVFAVGWAGTIDHYNGSSWTAMSSPTSYQLGGVWGSSSSDVFAVGASGTIVHYNGTSWSTMTSGITNDLQSVWGTSSSNVFAVGNSGKILRYNGSAWSSMTSGTTYNLYGVWGSSATDVFAVGWGSGGGLILHYNGSVWSQQSLMSGNYFRSVWGSSSSDVFVSGYYGVIYHYNGSVWSQMDSGTSSVTFWGIRGSSSQDVFAVGDNGTVLHYSGAIPWKPMNNVASNIIFGVWGSSPSDVFAVGYGGAIAHYNGSAWSTMTSGTTNYLNGVWGSSPSDVFAVGNDGTIVHYNGTSWGTMTSGTGYPLYGIWGNSSSDVFAVGVLGTIVHYNGTSWGTMTSGTTNYLYSVWGSSPSDVFAVGDSGKILHYNGTSWSSMTSGTTQTLKGVWGNSSSNVFAVGSNGAILHYNGSAWSTMTSGTTNTLNGVWGSSGSDVFAVGNSGTILHYNGTSWSSMTSGTSTGLGGVWGSSFMDVFAIEASGTTVLHYTMPSTETYVYDQIGNIIYKNRVPYTYGSKPHAVTSVGSISYAYDANGNMITHGNQTITYDVENRPVSITDGVSTTTFVYDGDGNRVKKIEGGQTTVYIGKYYEKNTSTGTITTYYYLGDRMVALRNGTNLRYTHLDYLGSISVVTDASGNTIGSMRYYPYGSTRASSGSLDTNKKFTGQRLDGTGLYYYGARYYDPVIGRFVSADTIVPNPANPQALNRYSYVLNNPLKYTDPTGHGWWSIITDIASIVFDVYQLVEHPSWGNAGWLTLDVGLTFLPVIPAGAGPAARALGKGDKIIEGAGKIVEGVKIGSKTEKIVVKASEGFDSFNALKKAIGSAGENKEWHHIVEQCQAQAEKAGFDVKLIHNPKNVIAIDKKTNEAVNAYYSSKQRFTAGKTVRDWLTDQSFEEQYKFGMQVLKDFGVIH